ncbi:jg26494 [Pararge aegeria aegeria]|uniref:Jg26494 protein n=1 Tax=Pararge aegeria aegeria TaxID=348720 RepID=A0A8S4RVW9_9NEOP|nr:jg26494 [Pararge aegeria aegeria]
MDSVYRLLSTRMDVVNGDYVQHTAPRAPPCHYQASRGFDQIKRISISIVTGSGILQISNFRRGYGNEYQDGYEGDYGGSYRRRFGGLFDGSYGRTHGRKYRGKNGYGQGSGCSTGNCADKITNIGNGSNNTNTVYF